MDDKVKSLHDMVKVTERPAGSDLDRLVSSCGRVLTSERARLSEALHVYATGRARIIADAERELAGFRDRMRDQLRAFDAEHDARIAALNSSVRRLERMQDASQ